MDCGATPHSGQTSDMQLVMRALYVFKSRQCSDQNATGRVWYRLTKAGDFHVEISHDRVGYWYCRAQLTLVILCRSNGDIQIIGKYGLYIIYYNLM